MDLPQLQLFLAVMESPSVTRAAESVCLSPGAVSLQLRKLADELHTELFVRNGKRLAPTPAAWRLAEEFRPRTVLSLSNAFTSAPKELDPIPQFKATAKLGELLETRFSRSF